MPTHNRESTSEMTSRDDSSNEDSDALVFRADQSSFPKVEPELPAPKIEFPEKIEALASLGIGSFAW